MSFPINMTGFMQGSRPKGFPTQGLVAYWKMDGGAFLIDSWGNHNASYGGLSGAEGKINEGLQYNAAQSYFTIPHSTDFNFSDGTQNFSFSMGCWVNFSEIKNTWLFNKRINDGTNHEWQVMYLGGNLSLWCYTNNTTTTSVRYDCPFTPSVGEWYNITASHNAVTGESALYVNGIELSGTDSGVGGIFNTTTQSLQLGSATTWSTGNTLNGILDETWIKKHHHTTPAEASFIWNNGLGLTI